MTDKIRVLIVDDLDSTRESVAKLLQFEASIQLAGEASSGQEAIDKARELAPDVVMMDINLPDIDGIKASESILADAPNTQIVMMSVQSDADYMRRAMVAGARDFLIKPFSLDELLTAVKSAYKRRQEAPTITVPAVAPPSPEVGRPAAGGRKSGHVIAVYSPKGGVGCTTLAVNLAVSLADSGFETVLVDADLQFGDVAVMLNLKPINSIIDLVERESNLDGDLIMGATLPHNSGLRVLAAPARPEYAESVVANRVENLIAQLRTLFSYVIVDTSSRLDDVTVSLLEIADRALLVTQQELPGITSASRFLDLTDRMDFPPEKLLLVVNAVGEREAISTLDVARALKQVSPMTIPFDGGVARIAANQGQPFIIRGGKRRPIAAAVRRIADRLVEETREEARISYSAERETGSFLTRAFGRLLGQRA